MTADLSPLRLLLVTLAGSANRHQQQVIEYLVEENRVLKEQLKGRRARLTDDQRRRLAAKGQRLGRRLLRQVREFLQAYPTPDAVAALTARQWQRWTRAHRLSEARSQELWAILQQPPLSVPAHVVRAKARLMRTLVPQRDPVVAGGRGVPEGGRGFFREPAGGPVGPNTAHR
jgi:hypothetical protein